MRASLAALALLVVAVVPSVAAQEPVDACSQQCAPTDPDVNDPPMRTEGPVNVILYGHFENVLSMAPMNTVPPDPVHEPDLKRGFLMPTVNTNSGLCVPPGGSTCADTHFRNGEVSMWFCAGLLEFRPEGWYHGCHSYSPSTPVHLAGPPVFYLYVSSDSLPEQAASPTSTPAVMPEVRVTAALTIGHEEPTTVAYGASETATLVSLPGESQVYEFRVEILPGPSLVDEAGRWTLGSRDQGFIALDARVEQVNAAGVAEIGQPDWQLRTGARFPPRLILPTQVPLETVGLETTAVDGTAFVRSTVLGTFGSYDIDSQNVVARIVGPEGSAPVPAGALELVDVKRSIDHDGVHKPVSFVWRIDDELLEQPASAYSIEIKVRNLQGTYEVQDSISMPIAAFEGDAVVPGFDAGLFVVSIGLVASGTALRRRATR